MKNEQTPLPRLYTDLLAYASKTLFSTVEALPELTPELRREAHKQGVSTLLPLPDGKEHYLRMTLNIQNQGEHRELHTLMREHGIPYVILKGAASARYYPEPLLRMAGDVDFLVRPEDMSRAAEAVISAGFTQDPERGNIHKVFRRKPLSVWELHHTVNGGNDTVNRYLADVIDASVETDGMMVPTDFHHCFILLCHMAAHLTELGIGLRRLCDWAVFVHRVDVSRWEKELRSCGLWHFAQVMSQLSAAYLGLPEQPWFGTADEEYNARLMEDIFLGGHFGEKDDHRMRQVKYILEPDHSLSGKSFLQQRWHTLSRKAEEQNTTRLRAALDYAGTVLSGKRRPDTAQVVSAAKYRRTLYGRLELFKIEE